jgi:hypothetical protein
MQSLQKSIINIVTDEIIRVQHEMIDFTTKELESFLVKELLDNATEVDEKHEILLDKELEVVEKNVESPPTNKSEIDLPQDSPEKLTNPELSKRNFTF